jgi:hypothetical protein
VQRRDASQVLTTAPDGTAPRWLGAIGHVANLTYASIYPGGDSTMSCLLQVPPDFRTDAMNPGRTTTIWRGGSRIWAGKLAEPQPSVDGWTVTATGTGSLGNNFCDVWTTWDDPDDHINQAIARGLPWRNPGITGTSGLWLGDQTDSGSETITDFMNSITVQGALGWSVDQRDGTLTVAPLPTAVNRLLIATSPAARTVADDVNVLFLKYQITDDTSSSTAVATYGLAEATNAADVALHGPTESYFDTTSNGILSEAAAIANGDNVLARYNRANFTQPFTVGEGQLTNTGGFPVDLGAERAGTVCQLMLSDFALGGEVTAAPITFIVGSYEYDDSSQTAQITAFQTADDSLSGLLSAVFPTTATAD